MKPGNQTKDDDSPERIARNIQLLVSFLWGLLLGGFGYWFTTL